MHMWNKLSPRQMLHRFSRGLVQASAVIGYFEVSSQMKICGPHSSVILSAFAHTDLFTQRCPYTQTLSHTDTFTHRHFYTAFTHRSFYTQTLLHTETFTRKSLHTNSFTHKHFYTETLLHTEAFTHRRYYTHLEDLVSFKNGVPCHCARFSFGKLPLLFGAFSSPLTWCSKMHHNASKVA